MQKVCKDGSNLCDANIIQDKSEETKTDKSGFFRYLMELIVI